MEKRLFLAMLCLAASIMTVCSSCTASRSVTREVPKIVKETVHDTLRLTGYINISDTILITDSVAPNDKGGVDRWHKEERRSNRKQTDTVYLSQIKEVPVPYEVKVEVPVEVEKKRSLWECFRDALVWMVVGSVATILLKFFRKKNL